MKNSLQGFVVKDRQNNFMTSFTPQALEEKVTWLLTPFWSVTDVLRLSVTDVPGSYRLPPHLRTNKTHPHDPRNQFACVCCSRRRLFRLYRPGLLGRDVRNRLQKESATFYYGRIAVWWAVGDIA